MYKLVILLTLQIIRTASQKQICGEDECCTYEGWPRGFIINCQDDSKTRTIFYIECRDNGMSIFCSPKNASDWMGSGLIMKKCEFEIRRLDFYNCMYPKKPFYDIIRKFSTGTDITTVSFSSREVKHPYMMKDHFVHFPNLTTLNLNHGGFERILYDIIQAVPKLVTLNLSNNSITDIRPRVFIYGTKLKHVDLSLNEISYINSLLFRDVPDLRFLSLESNKLTDLNEEMFERLSRLEDLDIGKNMLKTLPTRLFGTLQRLRKLSIGENEFSSLPSNLLANNSDLEEFDFSDNRGSLTSLPEAMFANLSYLKILRLGGNKLVELRENSFWGSYNLTKIDLSGNALTTLPENIFQDSENLLELNLNRNIMDSLLDHLFGNQNKLAHLYLGQNRLTTISRSIFSNLTSLIELDLSSNRIHHLEEDCFKFLSNLRIARLSNNFIESPINGVEVMSLFSNCKNLDALYLDHNKISKSNFRWMAEMDSLGILDMDSNSVSSLRGLLKTTEAMKDRTIKFRYIRIILTNNNITRIPLPWRTGRYDTSGLAVEVSVANNPLDCGCGLYRLLNFLVENSDKTFYYGYRFMLDTLACKEPARMQGERVREINLTTFSCPDKSKDNFAYCVKSCDCLWRPFDDAALIDCSRKFEGRIPDNFIGFHGKRIELNLIGNRLTKVPFSDTSLFTSITILFLSHNLISSISSIDIPPKIEVLHLDHNRLKMWDVATLRAIELSHTFRELALEDNPWKCDRKTERSLALIERKFAEPVTYTSDSRCIDGRHLTQYKNHFRLYITYTRF